jgi:hypothetical protein
VRPRVPDAVVGVVIREDSRFGWLIIFIPSGATTTVSAVLRAELHLAAIVVCPLRFSDRCF